MTMTAGIYYVGDLAYVMHDRWDKVCDKTINGYDCVDGEFVLEDGTRFASYGTAWGDGQYEDNYGNSYGVDAGLIGCIRVSDIAEDERKNLNLGNVHTFHDPFETGYTDPHEQRPGKIYFGDLVVDTNPDYDEDEYDEYDDEYAYGSEDA